tara:strand:+ start:4169 stop:4774 length:606 start_codon:yes stop_codon:yes gene_type:complete
MGKQINMDGSTENVEGNSKVLKPGTVRINKKGKVAADLPMVADAVENDLLFELEKAKEIKEITSYNTGLPNVDEDVANIKLHGNNLLVKLYKHNPFTDAGLHQPIMTKMETKGGRYKSVPTPLQYINYGVIVNMSGEYSEGFKERFKIGDQFVMRSGLSLDQLMFFIDLPKLIQSGRGILDQFGGTFKINENMIENGFKNK